MSDIRCACPGCDCRVDNRDWLRDRDAYCCQACYEHHPAGMTACQNAQCSCGENMARGKGDDD